MKTLLLTAWLLGSMAGASLATLDPDPDSMGICFDTMGDVHCSLIGPFVPVSCRLILANPTQPVEGFACTILRVGASHFWSVVDFGGPGVSGLASGDPSLPVAGLNTMCPVADEPSSFGGVKSLYR